MNPYVKEYAELIKNYEAKQGNRESVFACKKQKIIWRKAV